MTLRFNPAVFQLDDISVIPTRSNYPLAQPTKDTGMYTLYAKLALLYANLNYQNELIFITNH